MLQSGAVAMEISQTHLVVRSSVRSGGLDGLDEEIAPMAICLSFKYKLISISLMKLFCAPTSEKSNTKSYDVRKILGPDLKNDYKVCL